MLLNDTCPELENRAARAPVQRRELHPDAMADLAAGRARMIPLSRGTMAVIDAGDYKWLSQWIWHCSGSNYARKNSLPHGSISMHRLIMNPPRNMVVDHKNGDRLDNRRANLRICTITQNAVNKPSRNKTGFKGVRKLPSGKFIANITINRKARYIGTFDTPEEAHAAFVKVSVKQHGEFANFR